MISGSFSSSRPTGRSRKGFYQLSTALGKDNAGTTPGDYLVAIAKVEVDPNAPPPKPGFSEQTRSLIVSLPGTAYLGISILGR